MKNVPVMPTASTIDRKYSDRNPLEIQSAKTETPIPKPRMCCGKISER